MELHSKKAPQYSVQREPCDVNFDECDAVSFSDDSYHEKIRCHRHRMPTTKIASRIEQLPPVSK